VLNLGATFCYLGIIGIMYSSPKVPSHQIQYTYSVLEDIEANKNFVLQCKSYAPIFLAYD
jgi:hypothetical protein